MNKPNDTLLSKEKKKTTPLKCPTANEKSKKDIRPYHYQNVGLERITPEDLYKLDKRKFAKSYKMTYCQVCGHLHPISRHEIKRLSRLYWRDWSREMHLQLTPKQRKIRAIKAGTQRAINAGQELRK